MPPAVFAQQNQQVELELVLALDVSTSVDATEFILQRRGYVRAFRHSNVINAIMSVGDRGIAVSLIQWSSQGNQHTMVDWTHVHDRASSLRLARAIETADRELQGMTYVAGAIEFAVNKIDDNQITGQRRVIDISGDGTSDPDSTQRARNLAISRGITINGLPIHTEEYDLGELARIELRQHYANHIIGGEGAFMMDADGFEDFPTAIRRKLVREITGPNFAWFDDNQQSR